MRATEKVEKSSEGACHLDTALLESMAHSRHHLVHVIGCTAEAA